MAKDKDRGEKGELVSASPGDYMRRWFEPFGLSRWFDEPFGAMREGWMRIEEKREGDSLVIRAELPGIDPDKDVHLWVSNGMLHITAERREETKQEDKDKGSYRSEFRYGSMRRSVNLPPDADEDDVKASYSDGILEVRLPVAQEAAARRMVPITRGASS